MPGYDATGPMGRGPLTGRGLGRCRRPAADAASTEDLHPYDDFGWGDSPWPGGGGGRGFRGRGRGRGRGFGRGRRGLGGPLGPGGAGRQRETFLMRRMDELTAALDRVKEILSPREPAEPQDRS